ncbi:hypothetical protein ACFSL6_10485 [Paenibacillus thailandensis]|uniref:Uncharacterized protein n=1 Tax=Paenibacillus thailandensis TaxID=393250 RepID=A0ABW5R4J4_9BACL
MSTFTMEHINPEGLFRSEAFSQAIAVTGRAKTIYIGGQNAINSKGEPLVTVLFVSEFASRPSCLSEIDGIALIEDKE